jgi:O-antigen ligase
MLLPLILYGVLLSLAIFAPIRWALVAYLMLSTVDFFTANAGVGVLNAAKGLLWPLILLWRLREFGGHARIVIAPVAWLILVGYAAIASMWSLFPLSAVKLVGEMTGSFLICMVFMRAAKGGFLTPRSAVYAAIGCIGIATLRMAFIRTIGNVFAQSGGDSADRFTAFTSAQAFAALMVAFYCVALCSKSLLPWVRLALGATIAVVIFLDGSRLWLIAMTVATLVALLISETSSWAKIFSLAGVVLAVILAIAAAGPIVNFLRGFHQYRIAAAIVSAYEGNQKDSGLGTFRFRRQLDARALKMLDASSLTEWVFGHGTSNGRLLNGNFMHGIGDPNRAVHNEWLRILYEWGIIGSIVWLLFVGSLMMYAYKGVKLDPLGYARPLFSYVPAFCIGVTGENILAGAGHAENIGMLLLIGMAGMAYRTRLRTPETFSGKWAPVLAAR